MELIPEITHNMLHAFSLSSVVIACRGDILGAGNPSKERDTWKVKCEVMNKICFYFLKDFTDLQEKDQAC